MHVRDAGHGDKREVVQDPADDGVEASVVDLIDFRGLEFFITALPAHEVPAGEEAEDDQGQGAAPVNEGVAEEEVFDDMVIPAAHA